MPPSASAAVWKAALLLTGQRLASIGSSLADLVDERLLLHDDAVARHANLRCGSSPCSRSDRAGSCRRGFDDPPAAGEARAHRHPEHRARGAEGRGRSSLSRSLIRGSLSSGCTLAPHAPIGPVDQQTASNVPARLARETRLSFGPANGGPRSGLTFLRPPNKKGRAAVAPRCRTTAGESREGGGPRTSCWVGAPCQPCARSWGTTGRRPGGPADPHG